MVLHTRKWFQKEAQVNGQNRSSKNAREGGWRPPHSQHVCRQFHFIKQDCTDGSFPGP
jgi:hypothetical protein